MSWVEIAAEVRVSRFTLLNVAMVTRLLAPPVTSTRTIVSDPD